MHYNDWDDEEEPPKPNKERFSPQDYANAHNCADWAFQYMTFEEKLVAASNFGENWANILSGLGDQ
jgi:hypothetical protein